MKRSLISFALFFMMIPGTAAQSWQVWDVNNSDLPSNHVWAITDDIYGNIWVGTDWGLAKFDGLDWEVFQIANSQIPDNDIRALASDAQGRIWIGTFSAGLVIKDGNSWTTYDLGNSEMPSNQVRCIELDDDVAWIGTPNGLAWFDGIEWRIYNDLDISYNGLELPGNNIAAIAVRYDGLVCLGTINAGFTYLTDSTVTVFNTTNNGLPDNTALGVAIDGDGERWAACPAGALLRHGGAHDSGVWFQYSTLTSGIPTDALNDVVIDQENTRIVATQIAGVAFFSDPTNWVQFNEANSDLPDDVVLTLHLDSAQALWAGTESGGLAKYEHISSIEAFDGSKDLVVFPTLATDHLSFVNDSKNGSNYEVVDLNGQIVMAGTARSGMNRLDISSLSSSMYILKVHNSGNFRTKRFTKL